ncbi:DUF2637 domain-containing protein [Nocardia sp. PE-7]|uniref:DUF2637 domain-containing protein n=1 Tax=Nocardia sp. PE-7 TaxID=3058426 RepID=UPI002657CBF0|nr:DUF2637 domain-containing protein [Nocardia sp. PE-7]WKG08248.1 DUF2637 domain-containing protein [Nocardia sp. PE-7]
MSTADQQPKSVRWARWSAVLIVLVIGGAAFVLSFAALRDLAVRAHTPTHLAWLFPVIVDGTIIQATIAVLALADSPERSFFTRVLIAGATVSIGGNIAHALVSGHGALAAILAVIAPAALLLDTHGLAVLLRSRNTPKSEPATPAVAVEAAEHAVPEHVPAPTPMPTTSPIPLASVRPTTPPPVRVVQPFQPPRPVAVPSGGH